MANDVVMKQEEEEAERLFEDLRSTIHAFLNHLLPVPSARPCRLPIVLSTIRPLLYCMYCLSESLSRQDVLGSCTVILIMIIITIKLLLLSLWLRMDPNAQSPVYCNSILFLQYAVAPTILFLFAEGTPYRLQGC